MARFSRAVLQEEIQRRVSSIQKQYRFDPGNGTNQVRNDSHDRAVAYGEFRALLLLADEFDLMIFSHIPVE